MGQGFWEFVKDYWEVIALLATWLAIFLVAVRQRTAWQHGRFLQQVNFSLNYEEDGVVMIRTLLEVPAEQVWINEYGIKQVLKAARQVSRHNPFLRLRSHKEMAFVKRAAVNALSERFAEVFVARTMGLDVQTERFLFGITLERDASRRAQKFRVIVARRDDLDRMFDKGRGGLLDVESDEHRSRIAVLRRMYAMSRSRRNSVRRMLGEVELGVIVPRHHVQEHMLPVLQETQPMALASSPKSAPASAPTPADTTPPRPDAEVKRADVVHN